MDVEDLQTRLTDGRAELMRLLEGVTEEQFKRRPPATPDDPTPWSIAEVLAHLLSYERIEAERIAMALDADGEAIEPRPPEWHEGSAKAGRLAPVPQLIHGLLASRREIEKLVERAGGMDAGLARRVVHPMRGNDTVGWMLEAKVIEHEAEHAAQIEALRDLVGAATAAR